MLFDVKDGLVILTLAKNFCYTHVNPGKDRYNLVNSDVQYFPIYCENNIFTLNVVTHLIGNTGNIICKR